MKHLLFSADQLALVIAAAVGFSGSTWAFRKALDAGDHCWMTGAFALLVVSYIPYLKLLGHSMSATIVATSMTSQMLALAIAFGVYGEPITPLRAFGLLAAFSATLAFAYPVAAK